MKIERKPLGLAALLALGLTLSACDKQDQPDTAADNNAAESSAPAATAESDTGAPSTSAVVAAADDGMVTTKVKSALLADDTVKGLDINVDTKDGIVQLNGEVENQTQIDRAAEVARKVEGVQNVTNNLTIKPAEGQS